jgi:hypothetical protein
VPYRYGGLGVRYRPVAPSSTITLWGSAVKTPVAVSMKPPWTSGFRPVHPIAGRVHAGVLADGGGAGVGFPAVESEQLTMISRLQIASQRLM